MLLHWTGIRHIRPRTVLHCHIASARTQLEILKFGSISLVDAHWIHNIYIMIKIRVTFRLNIFNIVLDSWWKCNFCQLGSKYWTLWGILVTKKLNYGDWRVSVGIRINYVPKYQISWKEAVKKMRLLVLYLYRGRNYSTYNKCNSYEDWMFQEPSAGGKGHPYLQDNHKDILL